MTELHIDVCFGGYVAWVQGGGEIDFEDKCPLRACLRALRFTMALWGMRT